MMKNLVAGLLAGSVMAFASGASAADFYADGPSGVYDWSGFYLGLQAGGGWTRMNDTGSIYGLNGFMLGAHAGYNFQSGNFVFGVEGDLNYNWNRVVLGGPTVWGTTRWDGSVRGRLGYAIDRTLLYATGGVAFTNLHVDNPPFSINMGYTGWTLGAGVEHAFTKNLTARLEYRYTGFGRQVPPAPFVGTVDLNKSQLLVGVSYKF